MFSFTAILSRRRTRHLNAQWQFRTGLLIHAGSAVFGTPCIANAKTKRDWLSESHVTLDECNLSLGQPGKNCCPATNHCYHSHPTCYVTLVTNIKETKMAAKLASLESRIFENCVEIILVQSKKNA